MRPTSGSEEMDMPIWDKAVLFHDIEAFVEHLQRLETKRCRWLVVPLTTDESSLSLKCSKCNCGTDLAALYSIAFPNCHQTRREYAASCSVAAPSGMAAVSPSHDKSTSTG
jgi:hypothetical protein